MSAFICDNKTISVIARAFVDYGVTFRDGKYHEPSVVVLMNKMCQDIGQSLLAENYRSVNFRYRLDDEVPEFEYEPVDFDEGMVWGCIQCYEYQSCETEDWYGSEIQVSLKMLKNRITERLFRKLGMKVPYGYDGFDTLGD